MEEEFKTTINDLSDELLVRIFDSGQEPITSEERVSIQLTCKRWKAASYASRLHYSHVRMYIAGDKSVLSMRSALAEMSKTDVIRILTVHGKCPLENVFVRPLKLAGLREVRMTNTAASIDVLAILDSLGCVNVRELTFVSAGIMSCHLVPWHEYESLQSLDIRNLNPFDPPIRFLSNDAAFPPNVRSLKISKTTLPLSALYAKLSNLERMVNLSVVLGADEPFFYLPPPERSVAELKCLSVAARAVPRDMSSLTNLRYFHWDVPRHFPEFAIPAFPENMPETLLKVRLHAPAWLPGLESCVAWTLKLMFFLDGTDLSFPVGEYLSHVRTLALTVLCLNGTEFVDYDALRFATNVEVIKLHWENAHSFLEAMRDVEFPKLRKFVIVTDDDADIVPEYVDAAADNAARSFGTIVVVVRNEEDTCSESDF